jgi:hypothetical protein
MAQMFLHLSGSGQAPYWLENETCQPGDPCCRLPNTQALNKKPIWIHMLHFWTQLRNSYFALLSFHSFRKVRIFYLLTITYYYI